MYLAVKSFLELLSLEKGEIIIKEISVAADDAEIVMSIDSFKAIP